MRFSIVALLATTINSIGLLDRTLVAQPVPSAVQFGILTIAAYLIWVALRLCAREDRQGFLLPSRLAVSSMVGFPVMGTGAGLIYYWEGFASSSSPNYGLLLVAVLVVLFGALAVVIGLAGVILGLWRMGMKCQNVSVKQGSVLFFLPYVGIVGAGLLLRGFWSMNESGCQPPPYATMSQPPTIQSRDEKQLNRIEREWDLYAKIAAFGYVLASREAKAR